MPLISCKVSNDLHSALRKLSMINGDGRLGNYLVDALEAHVVQNKAKLKEFDDLVRREPEQKVVQDPTPMRSDAGNGNSMEEFLKP